MTKAAGRLDYSGKKDSYFAHRRPEMLGYVPTTAKTILEVGCGAGFFGETIRKRNSAVVYGVEIEPLKAEAAKLRLDQVIIGPYDQDTPLPEHFFDCIVFNDVLEHLPDPWTTLRATHRFLKSTGTIVASIPNVQHFPTAWKLLIHGRWDYADSGILDITHLHFFTKTGTCDLLKLSGYHVESIEGINKFACCAPDDSGKWKYYQILKWILPPTFRHSQYLQFAIVAKKQDFSNG